MKIVTARLAGICASLFAILFAVGMVMATDVPDGDVPDSDITTYIHDNNKLFENIIGAYLVIAAGLLLLLFLVIMYRRFRAAEGGDGIWSLLVLVSGVTFSACAMIGASCVAIIALALKLGDMPDPGIDTARWLTQIGYAPLLVVGGPAAALMSASIATLIIKTKTLPPWIGYAGYLAALGALGSVIFVPMILFVVWMLVLGIVVAIRSEAPMTPAA